MLGQKLKRHEEIGNRAIVLRLLKHPRDDGSDEEGSSRLGYQLLGRGVRWAKLDIEASVGEAHDGDKDRVVGMDYAEAVIMADVEVDH
ncbi:Hypothetical predicted protein [Olea europaea subsp. europaea]|uniref:Uncharacterized protein n=1 Tax=Olea europaea subsp. europaea TaxID=158383 RepID=A0A8S0T5Q5_OLEEU|nr:Hypothetical predicted protein [Olea europaea subsp. europaea]